MRTLALISLALTAAGAASGQAVLPAPGATEVEPDPIYHVELVAFAYNSGNRSEEDFHHDLEQLGFGPAPRLFRLPTIELESVFGPGPGVAATEDDRIEPPAAAPGLPGAPPGDRLEIIEVAVPARAARSGDAASLPEQFRLLSREELELGEARARLDRLGAYTVLGHAGWAQAGVDTDRSVQLGLNRLGITNPAGTIEVSVRRFFRVTLDLKYFDGSGTLWAVPDIAGLAPLQFAESYALTTERTAIRRDELHYIDHPLFGILVRITRAPEIEEENESAGGSGPAG